MYVRIPEMEANVMTISQRCQEQLDCEEAIVLMDSKGQEIMDGPATQCKQ